MPGGIDLVALGQLGSLALALGFLTLFLTGYIAPRWVIDGYKQRESKLLETNDRLIETARLHAQARRVGE